MAETQQHVVNIKPFYLQKFQAGMVSMEDENVLIINESKGTAKHACVLLKSRRGLKE